MNALKEIAGLSHKFGTADYVKGGGGNTSVKNSQIIWIKPSGTILGELKPDDFVALDRARIAEIYKANPPAEPNEREAMIKDLMLAAVCPDSSGRPSVEAPLHNSFDAAFVVHTHPALVNGMTCAKNGAEICHNLFPDDLWVEYIDPGYTLCMRLREEIEEYAKRYRHQPEVVFLKNHGLFVAAETADRIHEIHSYIINVMMEQYRKAGIPVELKMEPPAADDVVGKTIEHIKDLLGPEEAGHVCYSVPFRIADGPISPDHIAYSRAYPLVGELSAEAISDFKNRNDYSPRVIKCEAEVFSVGSSEKNASLALELALDGAQVKQLAEAFGGIEYMTPKAAKFIDNWEVEAYRQKVAAQ